MGQKQPGQTYRAWGPQEWAGCLLGEVSFIPLLKREALALPVASSSHAPPRERVDTSCLIPSEE